MASYIDDAINFDSTSYKAEKTDFKNTRQPYGPYATFMMPIP